MKLPKTPFDLVELGFCVIRIPLGVKVPNMKWKQWQLQKPSNLQLESWFRGKATNYATVTGKISGIVVVDVDLYKDPELGQKAIDSLPDTPWKVRSPRGGQHHVASDNPDHQHR